MNKWVTYFFPTTLCVAVFSVCKAQNVDTLPSVVIQDSIYETTVSPNETYQFKEKNKAGSVRTRKVSTEDFNKTRSDKDYWYVDQKPPRERETSAPPVNDKGRKEREIKKSRGLFNIPWLNTLFWIILIGGFVALLVWFLATGNIRLFRKKLTTVEQEVEEQPTENIFEMNFEKEIRKAIDAKNYRLAVRLMYLRALKDLSNRNLINYTREKTNSEYLFQLAGTKYYKNFFRLTRNFDYTWYGQFDLSPDNFDIVQNDFSSFKQQLS